jgi:hypothetical protein
MELFYNLIILILIINAIFWSLFKHSDHCKFIKLFGINKCPSHLIHISFGIICFVLAVIIKQRNYIF